MIRIAMVSGRARMISSWRVIPSFNPHGIKFSHPTFKISLLTHKQALLVTKTEHRNLQFMQIYSNALLSPLDWPELLTPIHGLLSRLYWYSTDRVNISFYYEKPGCRQNSPNLFWSSANPKGTASGLGIQRTPPLLPKTPWGTGVDEVGEFRQEDHSPHAITIIVDNENQAIKHHHRHSGALNNLDICRCQDRASKGLYYKTTHTHRISQDVVIVCHGSVAQTSSTLSGENMTMEFSLAKDDRGLAR